MSSRRSIGSALPICTSSSRDRSGAGRAEVNHQNVPSAMVLFRPVWRGVLISAGGFTGKQRRAAIADGHADAIAFGRIFISNPDCRAVCNMVSADTLQPRDLLWRRGDGYTDYSGYGELAAGLRNRRHSGMVR